jgi:hypothetical protein
MAVANSFSFQVCYFACAKVAELADAPDLGSGTARCGGSSPPFRIMVARQATLPEFSF